MALLMPALVSVALLGAPVVQAPDDAAAVVDTFHAALAAGDAEAALACLAAEVVIFESGGAEMSRQEYAEHHLGGDMQFAAASTREVVDRQAAGNGDVAYVTTRSRTTGTFRDRQIDAAGVETMVLRRGAEGWKIVHVHWSSRSAQRDR